MLTNVYKFLNIYVANPIYICPMVYDITLPHEKAEVKTRPPWGKVIALSVKCRELGISRSMAYGLIRWEEGIPERPPSFWLSANDQ